MKAPNNKSQKTNNTKITIFKIPNVFYLLFGTLVLFGIWSLVLGTWSATFAQTTFDPLSIGVGARALGMGKAYVAVAEDCETIFINPAGLGEIDSFKFTSMSGTILEDARYTMLGGVFPLGEKTAIGLGYVAAGVTGIQLRDSLGTLQSTSDFTNSVFIASFGKKLAEKLSLGINFKIYNQQGSGTNDGNGNGVNMDIGLLQQGLGWFSLGAVGQNILRSSKIKYQGGLEEELPLTIKVGTKMHLFGEEFESAIISPFKVIAVSDINFNLETSKASTTHVGVEVSPNPSFTLRSGFDQDPVPGGIQSNFTYGVSLRLAGIAFHYAYHPYTAFADNNTHYFSLSFDERGWPYEGLPDTFIGTIPLENS